MKKIKNNKGFSLVELIVVIAIMAVLVGVIAPAIMNNIEKSRESKDIQVLDSIASACQMALTDEAAYADAVALNVTGTDSWEKTLAELFALSSNDYRDQVVENLGGIDDATASSVSMTSTQGKTGTIYVKVTNGSQVTVSVKDGTDVVTLKHLYEADGTTAKSLKVTR